MPHLSWKERINELFGTSRPPEANPETMAVYLRYLRAHMEHPCYLIQAQEDSALFEALLLNELGEEIDADRGIMAKVSRSSDGREFTLPLAELECCEDDTRNSELVEDFTRWFMHTMLRRMSGRDL
jgi:hypothetical protein